ncbi:MAG TPA: alpha-2-macroglobulin family protein, partial [Gemmataceae bacterium]|nr:alpha-2-macroglobulin family protein [Gemmataceae bacterium]
EQLGIHKDQKQRKELKKAVAEKQLQKKADRAFAKQPEQRFDGQAGARAATPPMAPGMGNFAGRPFLGGRDLRQANLWPAMPVRVFAHPRASGPAEERYDFAETLYWHPVLVLPGGKTEVSFDLCDSLGAFEVTAFAHTLDGRLGSATQTLTSRLPFTVQPRIPLEVTAGDKIDIPLAIANNTSEARTAQVAVTDHASLSLLDGQASGQVSVPADTAIRKLYRFQPTLQEGTATLSFTGKAGGFPADTVRTTFRIVPEGFPIVGSHSDVLEKSATHDLTLPETWIKGTLKCQVQVYPSTLADLQKGLESLLREPGGCFEQTSTSNYPNVLILQYLKESDQARPAVERRAHELLDRGYQKLISFECLNPAQHKKQGYEWFGGTAPAHEALTAYGLMEFRDMARVHEVDPAMLKRTHDYLLQQRDGQGGFKRNQRALDTFGRAPQHITNAYIVWALTEGGKDDDITKELNALHEQAKTSKDSYFLSLVANALINRARTADAAKLLKKVSELQKADGHLDAEQTSITSSGGRDLQIETTSLALLAWLKANPGEFNANVQKAIKWLGQQRGGYGGFGSTQSTILALKALILYTKANKKTPEAGELRLFVGDKQAAALPFAAGATEPLTLNVPDAETTLKPGKNSVRVEITGKNVFPYTLTWSYQTRQPASADRCPVKLAAKLNRSEARESETVWLNVHVENASGKGQGMTVAILGLPGGLTIPEDMKQLKDYTRLPSDGQRPLVSAFEIRGRELVLYWRDLGPDQKIDVPIDLICRVPGEYNGPASRAYLYYNADRKHWVEPLKVRIAAKAE